MTLKRAFSLAEVLITLMIIGIIAGMTIPALKKDSMNKTVATNLKKIYSELNQSFSMVLAENFTNRVCRTGLFDDAGTFEEEFVMKKLNVTTVCSAGSASKCFGNSNLIGSEKSYLLTSGIAVAFLAPENACDAANAANLRVFVDVNGPTPPNKGGTDQFLLGVNGFGSVFVGSTSDDVGGYTSEACGNATDDYNAAWACAIQIQRDGWEVKY